jgi:hypothetical protein
LKRLLWVLVAALLPTPALATVLWKGNFETGDLTQYSTKQMVSADRLQVVTSPVREGKYALRALVKQGDNPINASGNRNELVKITNETPGVEYSYKWSTLFPSNYPSVNTWQLFTQWHQDSCCGSPPVEFYVIGEQIRLRVGGTTGRIVWTTPLARNKWFDFVMRVKWSSVPSIGYVELYVNGVKVVPKTMIATQFGNQRNYMKLGLYRNSTIVPDGIVYHDGFTMASSLSDVMPTAPVALTDAAPTGDAAVEVPAVTESTENDPPSSQTDTSAEAVPSPRPQADAVVNATGGGEATYDDNVGTPDTGEAPGLYAPGNVATIEAVGGCSASGGSSSMASVAIGALLAASWAFGRNKKLPARRR